MQSKSFLIYLCLLLASIQFFGQDEQINFMTYNILNYPSTNTTDNQYRADLFRQITEFYQADAIVIQELKSNAGANQLLTELNNNSNGITYAKAPIYNQWSGLGNMFFYNTAKMTFVSQQDVPRINADYFGGFSNLTPRPATHYRVYANDPNLSVHNDTTYLDFFSIHLKAGTDGMDGNAIPDNDRRMNGAEDFIDYIPTMPADRNIIIGGDFNFYDDDWASDTDGNGYVEPGYGEIINNGFVDVIGVWNRNTSASRTKFTQSTRVSNSGITSNGGATGGLDDRFDLIFMDNNSYSGTNNVTYINNSYDVFGSSEVFDGSALNGTHPLKVALHEMSDHYPVTAQYDIDYPDVGFPTINLNITVFLEGPFIPSTGLMRTELNSKGLLPSSQPYSAAPYNFAGTETVSSFPSTVVDWILVELRSGPSNLNTLSQRAGLLHNDGTITDTDGFSNLQFTNLPIANDLHFVVRHRNHADVMSSALTPANLMISYDFSDASSKAFFNTVPNQLKMVSGTAVMLAGDINQDLSIQTTDRDQWRITPAVLNIYDLPDTNMDGVIQTTDYDLWYINRTFLTPAELAY